jgi:hypothetical protein
MIPADDRQNRLEGLVTMAQHKGACEALLAACRLLRANKHHEASDLLIEQLEKIVEASCKH